MRDLILISIVFVAAIAALRRPWVGVLTWTWLSLMSPHRFTYGIAYDAPLAAVIAISTLAGFLHTTDKTSPVKGAPAGWLIALIAWIILSWANGLDPSGDYVQFSKVMKVDLMVLVALCLIHTKKQIILLAWVVACSLGLLGLKGGLFTVLNGGNYRVWGPPGSFIADNNEIALALVMTVPLLRFLQLQVANVWLKRFLTVNMLLCAAAAFGSQSRGGFLAVTAMALLLWARGKKKLIPAIVMLVVGLALIAFMPDQWGDRMNTIKEYQDDRSAMGRISAWWTAWNLAFHYPTGVGFDAARPELFARFSPYPEYVHAAHSIYFQILGNHGFVGLLLFLGVFISTWRSAGWLMRNASAHRETQWCADLGAMSQVSLLAYAVGGAFLSLSYFDLPYNIMVLVVCARAWMYTKARKIDSLTEPWWVRLLGAGAVDSPSPPGSARKNLGQ